MWSPAFLNMLNRKNLEPRFLLESIPGTEFEPTTGLALSSHLMPGYHQGLTRTGNRFSAGRVVPGDWSCSLSSMTLGFRGRFDIRRMVARGQLVELRVGFPGWAAADYQPVYRGAVVGIDRAGDNWSIGLRSMISTALSRPVVDTDGAALFDQLGSSVIETFAYDPDDVLLNVLVVVADASSAEREAGQSYLLQVFPDAGDPFFLLADDLTSDIFTLVAGGAVLGTTASIASPGCRVVFCALVEDYPQNVVRRVLTTIAGDGANGIFDTLPATWGLGLPDWLLDTDDIDHTGLILRPGSADYWRVYATQPADDGLAWIQGVLSPIGAFLAERQGLLTIRAASPSYLRPYEVETITDADLISIDRVETWSSDQPAESIVLILQSRGEIYSGPGAFALEALDSRPAVAMRVVDLPYLDEGADDWAEEIGPRLGPWVTRIAEIVEVTCRGLRLAALTPCDSAFVESRHLVMRDRTERPSMMILAVEPDWWEGTTRLVLAYLVHREDEL